MSDNHQNIEREIRQFLEESKSENDALKKLIAALQEEEKKLKSTKNYPGETSQTNNQ